MTLGPGKKKLSIKSNQNQFNQKIEREIENIVGSSSLDITYVWFFSYEMQFFF